MSTLSIEERKEIRKQVVEVVEELTAMRVLKDDGCTAPVDLRTIVELILANLKLELLPQDEFILSKCKEPNIG